MEDKIHLEDDSSDKKYFTIIPNYIANHSTANDQALYFQMKKHAGENGECFVSEKTLKIKLGIGKQALKKSIEYLLDHKWIKRIGFRDVQTNGGVQKVASYKIVDIWQINSGHYQGVSKTVPLSKGCPESEQGVSETAQRGAVLGHKEEPLLNKNHIKEDIEISKEISGKDINSLLEAFKSVNPSYQQLFKNKNQRSALERLLKLLGREKLENAIEYAEICNSMPYAPTITTPIELENKIGKLRAFITKEKVKTGNNKIIKIQ